MIENSQNSYGWFSIGLHWLSAVIVIGMFALGLWMVELEYYSQWYKSAPFYHKSIGVLLVILTLLRLGWRFSQVSPQKIVKGWENIAAQFTHIVLYILIFGMFFSGYLISTADDREIAVFNWFTLPSSGKLFAQQEDLAGQFHEWIAYSLIGLASVHALGALKHHFIDNNQILSRMLNPKTPDKENV